MTVRSSSELLYWTKYRQYIHYDNQTGKYNFDIQLPARALVSFGCWKKSEFMNCINAIQCRNGKCDYNIKLREGMDTTDLIMLGNYLKAVISGETANEQIQKCIEKHGIPYSGGLYVCETCKEFSRDDIIFFEMDGMTSPFGTYRCDYEFPLGLPKCEKCGSEKRFIPNIRSSKVKCPKCGEALKVKIRKRDIEDTKHI